MSLIVSGFCSLLAQSRKRVWLCFKHSDGASSRLHILLKQQSVSQPIFFFTTSSANVYSRLFFHRKPTLY